MNHKQTRLEMDRLRISRDQSQVCYLHQTSSQVRIEADAAPNKVVTETGREPTGEQKELVVAGLNHCRKVMNQEVRSQTMKPGAQIISDVSKGI